MTSEMALEDIDDMIAAGLSPTPADIIRLNALGLKVELNQSSATLYQLPRVAFLGRIAFREPSIGHSIWIDQTLRFVDETDYSTRLAVEAFALSRPVEVLPDADDRERVVRAIDDFSKGDLAAYTFGQVRCALTYAKYGNDETAQEFPTPSPDADAWEEDDAASIGTGVLFETLAMGLGLTVRDTMKLTLSKARALQEAGMARRGIDLAKTRHATRVAEYIATKNEIKDRLTRERDEENGRH